MATRNFKRVNLLGLDFYVDWIAETGEFISIKEVHSGRRFMFEGLMKDNKSVEDMFREAVGAYKPVEEVKTPTVEQLKTAIDAMNGPVESIVEQLAPAALETEQPKEDLDGKKTKGRHRKVQK